MGGLWESQGGGGAGEAPPAEPSPSRAIVVEARPLALGDTSFAPIAPRFCVIRPHVHPRSRPRRLGWLSRLRVPRAGSCKDRRTPFPRVNTHGQNDPADEQRWIEPPPAASGPEAVPLTPWAAVRSQDDLPSRELLADNRDGDGVPSRPWKKWPAGKPVVEAARTT